MSEIIYIEYLNKDKNFQRDEKIFEGNKALENAVTWGKKEFDRFNMDMIKYKKKDVSKNRGMSM